VTGAEAEAAARVLERLLSDPGYRARFRRNPVAASREAGLPSVAEEMAMGAGNVLDTLEERESRSSLAGVFMAAALEGVGIYDFSKRVLPHLDDVPRAVGDVLSRVHLPAIAEAHAATPRAQGVEPIRAAGEFPAITPARELLHNKHVAFDSDGIADLKAGKLDPRIVSVLTAISRDHDISISATVSDHDKFTSGGSVSNHYYGRAVDISVVDGQPVSPGNAAARKVAEALSRLPSDMRPSEIGSPWALSGPGYFTDGAHQNHIHVAFDDPIGSNWKPPEQLAAAPAAAPVRVEEEASELDDEEAAEPGGLEDPGGDTDAEADAESDGDGGDDNDSVSDDASDEEEDDEAEGDEDEGYDGDHDDSSDSGSDDTDDSDDSDGGEDDGGNEGDSELRGESGDRGGSGGSLDLGGVDGAYPGDDASKAEIAAWLGHAAQKRGLPPELPVMAALVESELRNLDHGDADSVGLFQMRVSIWNQGAYAGYPDNAELQLKWFLDRAVAVKQQRVDAGEPVNDPSSYGEWAADVERPAENLRYRYQLRLEEARSLLRQGMERGSRGHGGGDPGVEVVGEDDGRGAGPRALAAVAEARKYLGTPYQWGGSTPQTGFDCSGLVQWAYAKAGIRIPRVTYDQVDAPNGKRVDRAHLLPGDLVFFRSASGDVHHVGMSLGGDKFINAPSTGEKVRIDSLKESYYANEFYVGRRFDLSGAGRPRAAAAAASGMVDAEAPRVDRAAVRDAEAALARDAAEVQRPGTLLFEAVRAQEAGKMNDAQVLKAVDPPGST
jgi:NlpC/P60 family